MDLDRIPALAEQADPPEQGNETDVAPEDWSDIDATTWAGPA